VLLGAASHLGEHHREVRNLFLTEEYIASHLIEFLDASEGDPTWSEAVEFLRGRAESQAAWLVSVPLANLRLSAHGGADAALPRADDAMLVAADRRRDWQVGDSKERPFDVFHHLQDRMPLRPRWLPVRQGGERIDTRNEAALVVIERATPELALAISRTRARYALATWCLLAPPTHAEVWPTVGDWAPQPWMHYTGSIKPYEPGQWTGTSRTPWSTYVYEEPYVAPDDDAVLRAPFRAMARAKDSRCARALLSASSSLYASACRPNQLDVTERLMMLVSAVMTLCDPGGDPVADSVVLKRWLRVAERFDVWRQLDDLRLTPERIKDVHARIHDVRNIGTHGSDAVLINLGYPADAVRTMRGQRTVSGSDLALAVIDSSWQPLAYAVPKVLHRLWEDAMQHDFDDASFEIHFDGAGSR
jgi:hypothetical protein